MKIEIQTNAPTDLKQWACRFVADCMEDLDPLPYTMDEELEVRIWQTPMGTWWWNDNYQDSMTHPTSCPILSPAQTGTGDWCLEEQ